jgi:transposase
VLRSTIIDVAREAGVSTATVDRVLNNRSGARSRTRDAELYKERNIIERFFNKLKQFRRGATRYDKLLANFTDFVKLAAIAIWLKIVPTAQERKRNSGLSADADR